MNGAYPKRLLNNGANPFVFPFYRGDIGVAIAGTVRGMIGPSDGYIVIVFPEDGAVEFSILASNSTRAVAERVLKAWSEKNTFREKFGKDDMQAQIFSRNGFFFRLSGAPHEQRVCGLTSDQILTMD